MLQRPTFAVLLPAALLTAVFAGGAASPPPAAPAPAAPVATNSAEMERRLTQALTDWKAKGTLVSMADLQKQLDRRHCDIQLPAAPAAKPLALPTLYAQTKPAVMLVGSLFQCTRCPNMHLSTATGFMVTADGVMATNYHVVRAAKEGEKQAEFGLGAMDAGGRLYPVKEILAANREADVALVRLDAPPGTVFPTLPLRPHAPVGDSVAIVSNPSHHCFMLSTGIVSQYLERTAPKAGRPRPQAWMCVTAEYGVGSSGGPVTNMNGEVVGMVSSTAPVIPTPHGADEPACTQMLFRYCVPTEAILELVGGR